MITDEPEDKRLTEEELAGPAKSKAVGTSDEELDGVAGGYIVQTESDGSEKPAERKSKMEKERLNEMLKGIWDSLTDEQKEKAQECKSSDELLELAGKERIELPDEALDAISGGYIAFVGSASDGDTSWAIIHDETGAQLYVGWGGKGSAKAVARTYGVSEDEISWDRVDQIRKEYEEAQKKKKKKDDDDYFDKLYC